jgi:hypothetical protein
VIGKKISPEIDRHRQAPTRGLAAGGAAISRTDLAVTLEPLPRPAVFVVGTADLERLDIVLDVDVAVRVCVDAVDLPVERLFAISVGIGIGHDVRVAAVGRAAVGGRWLATVTLRGQQRW